jgi:protein-tyrosine phosphatase
VEQPATPPGAAQAPVRATRLLFVCLGNICRSPTAEGVMRALVEQAGLAERIHLDSAGTGSWHVGSAPDERAGAAASARGIALEGAARQVSAEDFQDFDLLLAMDRANLRSLRQLARGDEERGKVRLLREFDPATARGGELDVPDPYYGSPGGFEEVLDLVQAACEGLLAQIRAGETP